MYPENNSSNSQTASLSGMLFNHRRFAPWYDDRADYNTDAKSYYDYLARTNKLLDAISDLINGLLRREIAFNDTDTIDFNQSGNWEDKDIIDVNADVKISTRKDNNIVALSDGIYSTGNNTEDLNDIPFLKSELNDEVTSDQGKEFVLAPYLVRNAVIQAIYYDKDNGYYYIIQADVSKPEGFVVNKITESGEYVGNMWVKGGGHGSNAFFRTINNNVYVYYLVGQDYYYYQYKDNAILDGNAGTKSFTIPFGQNGMLSLGNEYASHIDGSDNVYIYKYYQNNTNFSFGTDYSKLNISSYMGNDLLQGIAVINKETITGNISENVLVMVSAGTPNVSSNLIIIEYDPDKNTFNYLKTINNLAKVSSQNEIFETYETEGLYVSQLNIDGEVVPGVLYGVSAGAQGQRKQYIYGMLSVKYSAYLSYLRSAEFENNNPKYVLPDATNLYSISSPGTYELKSNQTIKITDFPWAWRAVDTGSDWTLEVSKRNQYGDVTQRLTKRGVKSQMEIYERVLDFSTSAGYGSGYAPKTIGWWNLIALSGVKANDMYGGNYGKFTKLSDFSTPGQNYYVSSTALNKISDFEGIADIVKQSGFKISVENAGGSSDMIIQTVEIIQDGAIIILKRTLYGDPDTYGPKLIIDTSKNGKWFKYEGEVLS